MKTLPKLYARGENGKVLEWTIEIDGPKFRMVTGAQGFKKVESEWTLCEGKNVGRANATSPSEQAEAEAKSRFDKKKSSGYWENIKDVDKSQYIEPMLAYKYLDYKDDIDWSNGNYISPKMDGLRVVISRKGAFSRNGKKFVSFPHIFNELKFLFNEFPDLILDGECYTHALNEDFNKIISLAKKTKPTPEDIKESEKHLQYHVFDCPSECGGFHERFGYLTVLFNTKLKNSKYIKLCEHKLIKSEAEIEPNLKTYLELGYEGLMLNIYDGKYQNKRSRNILKYKLFQDEEFEIVGITEGIGNRSGMFGYATLKLKNGKTFDSNARGDELKYKRMLKEQNDLVGKKATVRFQNYTPDGIPRFPVIVDIRDYE